MPTQTQDGAADLYVAPNGDDRWTGTLSDPAPDRADGPFATLRRARDVVRALKGESGRLRRPITVMVRGGKYFLEEPLLLGPEDSGTRECPVTWSAYADEKPVISGGRAVRSWKPYRGAILQADLPGSRGGKWQFRQLFFSGKRMTRARWPKADPTDPICSGWAFVEEPAGEDHRTTFRYKPDTFRHPWAKPTEIEVVYWAASGGWNSRVPLKAVDYENRVMTLVHGGWQFDMPGWCHSVFFQKDNRFYIENALEELDQPGEWCFDSEEGTIYFWPPGGSLRKSDEVVVPALDCLVDLTNTEWVMISGLTFTETLDGDNVHREGVEGAGGMHPRPGWRYCGDAVHLKGASCCRITGNHFDAVGGNGVYLEGDCLRNTVEGNEFSEAGANAVCLLGTRLKHPVFNRVRDNSIHDCGAINKFTAGVFSGMSDGNVISHNRIEHLPHHAINLSNSPFGRNIVEYNEMRSVAEVVNDSGAINCWMEEPPDPDAQRCGHVIRFNYIADIRGCVVRDGKVVRGGDVYSCGMYLDNYTSNCLVYGNVIVRAAFGGILVHAGKNNLIENNVIVDCPAGIRVYDVVSVAFPFWKPMAGFMRNHHILRNIIYQTADDSLLFAFTHEWTDRVIAQSDQNVFWQAGAAERGYALQRGGGDRGSTIRLAQWQMEGYDLESVCADPLFVDPTRDDYRLKPDSPALKLGFQAIDMSKIGIRKTGTAGRHRKED